MRALTSSPDLTRSPKSARQPGLLRRGQASAGRVGPDRLHSRARGRAAWEGGVRTWHGAGALPGTAAVDAPTSSHHRGGHQSPFKGKSPSDSCPGLWGIIWRRQLVRLERRAPARWRGRWVLCVWGNWQQQQKRFALSCVRSQGLNTATKHPLSSLLPPPSLPAPPGAGPPRGLVLGEASREAGGSPAPPNPSTTLGWCTLAVAGTAALRAGAGPRVAFLLPAQQQLGGGTQRTRLCCKMSHSISLRDAQLLQIPACSAAPAGTAPGRGGDALIPDPSLPASFPLLKVHVSRWSQK